MYMHMRIAALNVHPVKQQQAQQTTQQTAQSSSMSLALVAALEKLVGTVTTSSASYIG
jgi:uncharacterized protein YcbX